MVRGQKHSLTELERIVHQARDRPHSRVAADNLVSVQVVHAAVERLRATGSPAYAAPRRPGPERAYDASDLRWFGIHLEQHALDYTKEHVESLLVHRGLVASRTMVNSMYKDLGITRKKVRARRRARGARARWDPRSRLRVRLGSPLMPRCSATSSRTRPAHLLAMRSSSSSGSTTSTRTT